VLGQPDVHVPVGVAGERGIEPARGPDEMARGDDPGPAARDDVVDQHLDGDVPVIGRPSPPDDPQGMVHGHDPHAAPPAGRRRGQRVQLGRELVGRPQVVVVDEGEPVALGRVDPRVAGLGDAP
jgi:hypothetical protein